jgi:hypothetical protein
VTDRSQTATTIQNAAPYVGQLPFLAQGWGAASDLLNRGALVPDAFGTISARASAGDPGMGIGADYLKGVINAPPRPDSAYLQSVFQSDPASNPYLDAMYNRAAGAVRSSVDSDFARAGRYGSGARADVTGRNLVDLATQIYGGQYNADQARRLQAAQLYGSVYGGDVAARMAAAQALPSALMARDFGYPEEAAKVQQASIDAPSNLLARYLQMVGGNYGSQITSQAPHFTNPLGQGIGALGGLANAAYLGAGTLGALNKTFPSLFGNASPAVTGSYADPNWGRELGDNAAPFFTYYPGAGAIGGFSSSPALDWGGPLTNIWGGSY